MVTQSVLVFDIEAPLAFFKIGEVTRATISYPFSGTSLIGIIGAILGRPRNSYWVKGDPLGESNIGLAVIKPIKHLGLTVNYSHTKITANLGRTLNTFVTTQSGKEFPSFVTDVRLDYLRNVHYRVIFQSGDKQLQDELRQRLVDEEYYYTPYMGHANLLCDVKFIGECRAETSKTVPKDVHSVVPVTELETNSLDLFTIGASVVVGIPIGMRVNEEGKASGVNTVNFLIPGTTGVLTGLKFKDTNRVVNVHYPQETVYKPLGWNAGDSINVVFFPSTRGAE